MNTASVFSMETRRASIVAAITKTCPLRVQIASQTTAVSPTGGLISGGFAALAGLDSIPAQRVQMGQPESVALPSGKSATVSHVWTLPGTWQIPEGATLREMVAGNAVAEYIVLVADVHIYGIHTDLKTQRVKK